MLRSLNLAAFFSEATWVFEVQQELMGFPELDPHWLLNLVHFK